MSNGLNKLQVARRVTRYWWVDHYSAWQYYMDAEPDAAVHDPPRYGGEVQTYVSIGRIESGRITREPNALSQYGFTRNISPTGAP